MPLSSQKVALVYFFSKQAGDNQCEMTDEVFEEIAQHYVDLTCLRVNFASTTSQLSLV